MLIQFIIVKKHNDVEYFAYLKRQIRDPIIPIIPLKNKLFDKIEIGARFYFVHSYYFKNYNEEESIAYTNYPFKFCCAVQKNNIFGVQFHPEKSHKNGLQLLKNFSEI